MLKRLSVVMVYSLAMLMWLSCTQADSPTNLDPMTSPSSTDIPATPVVVAAAPTSAPTAAEPTYTSPPTTPPPTATTVPIVPQTVAPISSPSPTPTETPVPTSTAAAVLQPGSLPIALELAPLGDNLQWVAFFDNRTQGWSIYDPSGTFTIDALIPISPPGLTIPEETTDLSALTELVPGSLYLVSVVEWQDPVLGGEIIPLVPGVNYVAWAVG